jgi:hypothetical protein
MPIKHVTHHKKMEKKFLKKQAMGWTASTLTDVDLAKVRKEGVLADSAEVVFPSTEIIPHQQPGFRVMLLAFLLRGLSLPAHEFLCGQLFVYDMQLHQLTPNSILHIACFITLCEAFMGINPHWACGNIFFRLRPNVSKEEIHDLDGTIISVRSESQYLAFKMAESVQN